MRLYIVRHAIAHERDRARWPDDSLRPLTAEGERRFRKAARGLAVILPRSAKMLTSPYVRARKTAEVLASVARLSAPKDCTELAAVGSAGKLFAVLARRTDKHLVVVGHEPGLGKLLVAALAGQEARFAVTFKKGGAACVEFRGRPMPGRAKLLWMLPPRTLRALR
jgi:phosphohistidine phosphatase